MIKISEQRTLEETIEPKTTTKQLKKEEYSDSRKKAMKEIEAGGKN